MDSVLGCVAPVVDAVRGHLISTAKEEFRTVWYLEDEINNTSKFIDTFRSVEEVAERKQLEDQAVRKWLLEFKNAVYDKEDVECDYREMVVRVEDGQRVLTWWKGRAKDGLLLLCSIPLCCLKDILPLPITPRIEIARKLRTININLAKIDQQRTELVSLAGGSSDDAAKKQVSSPESWKYKARPMIGREEIKSEIKETLLKHIETSCSKLLVIGIVGAGGMGKTTLAHSIFNDEKVMDAFDTKKLLYVGENSDIKEIMNRIISDSSNNPDNVNDIQNDSIKNNKNDIRGNSDLQNSDRIINIMKEISNLQSPDIINDIRNEIIDSGDSKVEDPDYLHSRMIVKYRKKNVLIVLDDVWCTKAEEWDLLRTSLSNETKANALIVTTRNKAAARAIPHESTYFEHELLAMRDDECMEIFKRWAFMGTPPHKIKEFEGLSRQVVQKLKGVPLAAKIMGSFLKSHLDNQEKWRNIINHQLETDDGNVIDKITGLSYIHLPPHLKHCFAYCAMFPKGYKFDKKDLVQMWIVQGYVLPRKNELLEHTGKNYFNDLYLRSLFQLDRDDIDTQYFVVHDLIHDFACKIFIEGHRVDTSDSHQDHYTTIENLPKRIRHLTLEFGGSESSSTEITRFDVTKLRSLICHGNLGVEYVLTNKLRYLRLLIIRFHDMEELPHSIQHLKLLRYLDVSETGIKSLPETTCDLVNLQFLNLPNNCTALPEGMSKLVKLRFVKTSKYEKIAYASIREIGKLTDLQGHDLYFTVQNRSGWEISELKGLNHLRGTLTIDGLEHVKSKKEAEKACLDKKRQIETLVLRWNVSEPRRQDHIADDIQESRQEFPSSLSQIEEEQDTISSGQQYRTVDGEAEEVLDGLCPPPHLNSLVIHNYHGAWPPRWMENSNRTLTELKFHGFTNTKQGHRVHVECLLPFLSKLIIQDSPRMTSLSPIISLHGRDKLQTIRIINCLEFATLKQQNADGRRSPFPCLEDLYIEGCPKLTSLMPISLRGLDKLKYITFKNCPELASFQQHNGDADEWHLTCLEELFIDGCLKLSSLMPLTLHCSDKLKYITIKNCSELASLQLQNDNARAWYLPCLEGLYIERCPKLTSLMPITYRGLHKLKYIYFINSPQLSLFQQHDGDGDEWHLPCLENLFIDGCPKLSSLMPLTLHCSDKLKYIIIKNCSELASLQLQHDDARAWYSPCLEGLCIEGCPKLSSLMPLILHCSDKLKYIIIKNCSELASLQLQHDDARAWYSPCLEVLYIEGCPKLTSLMPLTLHCSDKLKYITIKNCHELASFQQHDGDADEWHLTCLENLLIDGCPKLSSLMPLTLHCSDKLKYITIRNCSQLSLLQKRDDDARPWYLPCLENLCIEGCPKLTSLMPISLRCLVKLKYIRIKNCSELSSFQQQDDDARAWYSPCLEGLYIGGCPKLTSLMPISLCGSEKLKHVTFIKCPELDLFQQDDGDGDEWRLTCLEKLFIDGCPKLSSLMQLTLHCSDKLKYITIKNCPEIASFQQPDGDADEWHLTCLENLFIDGCPKLSSLMPLTLHCSDKLKYITIKNCPELAAFQQHDGDADEWCLTCLEKLLIDGCPKLSSLMPLTLHCSDKLKYITIRNCSQLSLSQQRDDDARPWHLPSLEKLCIEGCPKLTSLMPISLGCLNKLKYIRIKTCSKLASLQQQDDDARAWYSPCLEELYIEGCPKLSSLMPVSLRGLEKLKHITFINCRELDSFQQDDGDGDEWHLTCLEKLFIDGCPKLSSLMPLTLHCSDKLKYITIKNCPELASIQQHDADADEWHLTCLENLLIDGCPKLSSLTPLTLHCSDKLKYITIRNCSQLSLLQQRDDDARPWHLPSLEELCIEGCPKLTSLMPINMGCLDKLKYTKIKNCSELASMQQQDDDARAWYSPCLEGLYIEGCPKLTSLMPISLRGLEKLKHVTFINCRKLASFQQHDGDGNEWRLTCLEKLFIDRCPKLSSLMPLTLHCSDKLKYITIKNCHELASFQQHDGDADEWHLTCLENLLIDGCPKLSSLMPLTLHCSDKLKYITIRNCSQLSLLQQRDDDARPWYLLCLEELCIEGCPKLTSLMPISLGCLHKLKYIRIKNCFELASLQQPDENARACYSPCLEELYIEGCPKLSSLMPVSLRGLEKLKHVTFINCPELDSFQHHDGDGDEWHLTCLEKLFIDGCPKLSSLMPLTLHCSGKLKYITIRNCSQLSLLQQRDDDARPWYLPCLEELYIEGCPKLTSLMPMSLGCLDKLKYIRIRNCSELASMQQQDDDARAWYSPCLEELYIEGCPKLTSLMPISLRGLEKLQHVTFINCRELDSFQKHDGDEDEWHLTCLENLFIDGCPKLSSLMPLTLHCSDKLKYITIKNCHELASFQQHDGDADEWHLTCLENLLIDGCPKLSSLMPLTLHCSDKLKYITIRNCSQLSLLQKRDDDARPWYLPCLENLCIEGCPKLTSLMPISLRCLVKLKYIRIKNCSELSSFQQQDDDARAWYSPCLEGLYIGGCPKLTSLMPISLCGSEKLKHVTFIKCPELDLFQQDDGDGDEWRLTCLEKLFIDGCPKLSSLMQLTLHCSDKLKYITIKNCPEIASFQQPDGDADEWHLTCLENLFIDGCPKLSSLMPLTLHCSDKLKYITIKNCPELAAFQQHDGDADEWCLTCLEKLLIDGCPKLSSLMPLTLHCSDKLKYITIRNCSQLSLSQQRDDDARPWYLPCLEEICIEGCPKLTSLMQVSLGCLDKLKYIRIKNCSELASLQQQDDDTRAWYSPCLEGLYIEGCPKLTSLMPISLRGLDKLKYINFINCPELSSFQQHDGDADEWHLTCLEKLLIDGCPKLSSLMPLTLHCSDKLKYITIRNCSQLSLLQKRDDDARPWYLPCLEEICIEGCPKLTSLMPISLRCLVKLKYIRIRNCSELASLQLQDDDARAWYSPCLEGLYIGGCPKLTSLMPISLRGLEKLKYVTFIKCPEVDSFQQHDGDGDE